MITISHMKLLIEIQKNLDNMTGMDSGGHFDVDQSKMESLTEWLDLYHAPPVAGEATPPHRAAGIRPTPVNLLDTSLVHMVRHDDGSALLQRSCQEVMSNWDVLSCSLINYRTGHPEAISSVGFALRVPPQNIVGAHPMDICFPNHIGAGHHGMAHGPARIAEAGLLSGAIRYSVTKAGFYSDFGGGSASLTEIARPSELMAMSRQRGYNEVLIVGRPSVNIHGVYQRATTSDAGYIKSATEKMSVRFIIIYPSGREFREIQGSELTIQRYYRNYWDQACRLRKVNPNLAIKVARARAPGWNWEACDGKRASDGFI